MDNKKYPPKKLAFKPNPYIITIAILVLIIICSIAGRRSYKATYEAYIDASMAFDAEAMVSLLHESYIDYMIEIGRIDEKSDLVQNTQYSLDVLAGHVEYRSDESSKYMAEIVKIENCDMDTADMIQLTYRYGDAADNIKAAKCVTVNFNLYTDGECDTVYTNFAFYFVKIGQRWYLGEIPNF